MDYTGPFLITMFLIVVDSFSNCVEVIVMNDSTSTATAQNL